MTRVTSTAVLMLLLHEGVNAWTSSRSNNMLHQPSQVFGNVRKSSALNMALDYNDPVVGEEFAKVQMMDIDDVEDELMMTGIKAPATMNEMDIRLMLVELRMRMSGKAPGQKKKVKKTSGFASKFEEVLNTCDAFEELFEELKESGDHNSQNVAAEYLNNKEEALARYGNDYKSLIRKIEEAINKPKEVTNKIKFSGFPANMGGDACRMTLEALGAISSFEVNESDDFPILEGEAEFEDKESARKVIEQYNGMDMGMGSKIEIVSI